MNLLQIQKRIGSPQRQIRAGLVGAGEFGASFISQARRMKDFDAVIVCDRNEERARLSVEAAGYRDTDIALCKTSTAAQSAIERGQIALIDDSSLMMTLPIDVVVEATGNPEGAAATCLAAITNGKHSVMVTKEAEIVVGSILARKASEHGVIHTPVDGDQPSLLIGLIGWAQLLGLPIVAAGKASESDFVWDPEARTVTAWGRSVSAADYSPLFNPADHLVGALAQRANLPFERTTVPDLCEMGIVSNHTGLMPDCASLHAPIARTVELPHLFRPVAEGGLLSAHGRVDMFNCLRRPDELSFAGGVFVIVEAPDLATGLLFKQKGIPTSPDGRYVLLHNPVHLLGAEAPLSALSVAAFGSTTGTDDVRPRVDLVAEAARDLEPGEVLTMGARHVIGGLTHRLMPAQAIGLRKPLPYYLADAMTVLRPVKKGAILTCDDVSERDGSILFRLRREQDAVFGL
jgi:predicted homoserine dehydrogenase-like protein